ncbi:hypothetical protein BKA70DRAFT_1031244, partial [Coprinopsis sp. MPI-PUGE-AT-0042]
LHLQPSNHAALAFFARFVSHTVTRLSAPISKLLYLPTQQSTSAVLCSPFGAQREPRKIQRPDMRGYQTLYTSSEDVDLRCQCMSRHRLAKVVSMRVTKWER